MLKRTSAFFSSIKILCLTIFVQSAISVIFEGMFIRKALGTAGFSAKI
jgi:hypothetical protein